MWNDGPGSDFEERNNREILRRIINEMSAGPLPSPEASHAPNRWSTESVVLTNLPAADFSAANLGQLKNMARGAYVHMLARHGVSSFAISNMVHSFSPTNNFHVVTLGQAKHVAAPFYDWLIARGHRQSYPWSGASLTNDFAALNSGQLKSLFSLRSSNYAQTSQATPRQVEPIFGVKNRLYR